MKKKRPLPENERHVKQTVIFVVTSPKSQFGGKYTKEHLCIFFERQLQSLFIEIYCILFSYFLSCFLPKPRPEGPPLNLWAKTNDGYVQQVTPCKVLMSDGEMAYYPALWCTAQ